MCIRDSIKTVYLEVSLSTLQRGRNDSARIGASDRFVTLFGKLSSIFHETSSGVQVRKLLYSTRVTDYFDFSAVAANVSYKLSAESGQAPVMPDKEPQYLGRGFLNNDNVYSGKRYTDTLSLIHIFIICSAKKDRSTKRLPLFGAWISTTWEMKTKKPFFLWKIPFRSSTSATVISS